MAVKSIIEVANAMFKNKKDWKLIDDNDKEAYFFIFNRYFSKKYPYYAQLLNDKLNDNVIGMDILYAFFKDKEYPKWFWSKSDIKLEKDMFTEKELLNIQLKFDLRKEEIDFVQTFHLDELKEEIKYIKLQEKE